jgi:transposase InsO family protein
MREMSVAEQRYQAVLAVISDGETVTSVAARFGVRRQTVHEWLARYEAGGLENLADRSHRPGWCPHQMDPVVEVLVADLRHRHPGWGPRRLRYELGRRGVEPVPSESGVYRCLVRLGLIDPGARRPRDRRWRRWERGAPMELWQMDTVGGFLLADGTRAKALTGLDDHSRFCVSAFLMHRESSGRVCEGLALAMRTHGVPEEILTDNGKVFTGRFCSRPAEVLFDRVCRENGITHRLTQPRSPTTTGKVERFHRSLRTEFRTDRVFASLAAAQSELDEWVAYYNHQRPHQALDMEVPAIRFEAGTSRALPGQPRVPAPRRPPAERTGDHWVSRRAGANGVISVKAQQVCLGIAAAGHQVDVHVGETLLQVWDGAELLKTTARTTTGEVRKKRTAVPGGRSSLKTSVRDQPK